jgi:hypothetical protein
MNRLRRSGRNSADALSSSARDAIAAGLDWLGESQNKDGSWSLSRVVHGSEPVPAHGLFSTTAVLLSVGELLSDAARDAALDYVESSRGETGHWRFDPTMDIPFDVDDTACALAAIAKYRPSALTLRDRDILLSYWREPDGPFRTWDPAADELADYWGFPETDDAVVNSNVVIALRHMNYDVSARVMDAVIELCNVRPTSRYYDGPAPVLHAASRLGIPISSIPQLASISPSMKWDVLQLAMWLRSRATLDEAATKHVISLQSREGHWDYCHWCTGNFSPPISWGSSAVTTAIVVDALLSQARIAGWETTR